MKKVMLSVVAALAVTAAAPAFAADMPVKAKRVAVATPSPWDIAFGGAMMNNYMFRGISQSANQASLATYFEPRYNINPNLQIYAGIAGESIKFPNGAAAEIDLYAGVRPTFGAFAFDFGFWYYGYPGGNSTYSLNGVVTSAISNASFYEWYGKGTWTVNDMLALGANVYYTPSWLNTGAPGTYYSGTAKITLPGTMLPKDIGMYLSGELGRQALGTVDFNAAVYPIPADLPDYTTWNVGIGFTWKVFTLDLRYSDTNLSKSNCFILTGDNGAGIGGTVSTLNGGGNTSKWCGATFIAKLSADLTLANLK